MNHRPVRILLPLLGAGLLSLLCLCQRAMATAPPPAAVFGGLPGVQHVAISPNGQLLAADRTTDAGTSVDVYDIGAASVRRTIHRAGHGPDHVAR